MPIDSKINTDEFYSQYPHLEKRIEFLWGSRECRDLLMSLTGFTDSDRASRAGFAPNHLQTILLLLADHDALYPQFGPRDIIDFSSYANFHEKKKTRPTPPKSNWAWLKWVLLITVPIILVKCI